MDAPVHHARSYRIRPLRDAIVIGVLVFVTNVLTVTFLYFQALEAEDEEIKENLVTTAKIVATMVDGDLHRTFVGPEHEATLAYQEAIRPLGRVILESCEAHALASFLGVVDPANGCPIIFVYTVILVEGAVHYVLDPWPAGIQLDPETEMKSHIMDGYPEASDELRAALEERRAGVSAQVYSDRWGKFLSGYAPFYDSAGEFVGTVGVDISAKNYLARLEPIRQAAKRAYVVLFFVSYLIGAMVWYLRNMALAINTKRLRLLEDYQDVVSRSNDGG